LACIILAGRFSLACGCRYCCSGGRQRQRSQKSTLGNPSAFCSVMASVSDPVATKSPGGYSESQSLESGVSPPCRTPNFRFSPLANVGRLRRLVLLLAQLQTSGIWPLLGTKQTSANCWATIAISTWPEFHTAQCVTTRSSAAGDSVAPDHRAIGR